MNAAVYPARLGRFKCLASFSDVESKSDAGTTPRPCVNHRRSEWFHHSVAWKAVRLLGVRQSHMPTAMLGVRNGVLPNARNDAGDSAACVSSGTAVRAIHATARNACVARVSRNCQIKTDAKCMQSSNAVKAMAARQFRVQKRTKEGSNPQGMSLTKKLEAETATRPKIQPRLKHRGKDKPLAFAGRGRFLDGGASGASQLHRNPFGGDPLKRERCDVLCSRFCAAQSAGVAAVHCCRPLLLPQSGLCQY